MAAKISFVLLALFVAASMQMPDYEARSRVRRGDDDDKETPNTDKGEVKPNGGDKTGKEGGTDGKGENGGGFGGFSSLGEKIPGKDIYDKYFKEMFMDKVSGVFKGFGKS